MSKDRNIVVKMIKDGDEYIIKIRGLPWSSTVDDILDFFDDCSIKNLKDGVHLTKLENGRPSGEAYIELTSKLDLERALKKNRRYMGHRYIEVFQTTCLEMDFVVPRCGLYADMVDEACVRLRGLPFDCSETDIYQFFNGLEVVPNGITFIVDDTDSKVGDAYVQFSNKDVVEKALERHMQKIRHRYVEIFRSSLTEMSSQSVSKMKSNVSSGCGRSAPYDRNDRFARNIVVSKRPLLYHRGAVYFADERVNFSTCELWNDNTEHEIDKPAFEIDCADVKDESGSRLPHTGTVLSAYAVENNQPTNDSVIAIGDIGKVEPDNTDEDTEKVESSGPDDKTVNNKMNGNEKNNICSKGCSLDSDYDETVTHSLFNPHLIRTKCVPNSSYGIDDAATTHNVQENSNSSNNNNNNSVNVLVDRLNLHTSKLFSRSVPYMKNKSNSNETARFIHMRGLPFKATNDDIIKFFKPFNPIKIHIICDKSGRSSGEADVEFATHEEATEAMIKDKQHIKTRYIELFLNYISQKSAVDKDDKLVCKKSTKQKFSCKSGKHCEDLLIAPDNNKATISDNKSFNNENVLTKQNLSKERQPKITLLQRSTNNQSPSSLTSTNGST